jgi:hypothetical protein
MSSFSRKTAKDVKTYTFYSAATKIASENSAQLNVQNFSKGIFYLKTENSGGTTPTLDIKFQTKTIGGDWVDIPGLAFTQATGDTSEMIRNVNATYGNHVELGQFIRAVF